MGKLSNTKGKVGERAAAKYLRDLGFAGAHRTQQHNGLGDSDVTCPALPGVHIEVKFGYSIKEFRQGMALWVSACEQAGRDSKGRPWCVLWKAYKAQQWCLTVESPDGSWPTFGNDGDNKRALIVLAERAARTEEEGA